MCWAPPGAGRILLNSCLCLFGFREKAVPAMCHESSTERQTQRALQNIRGMNIDLKTNLTWFLNRLEKCVAQKSQGFVVCQWSGDDFTLVLWFNKVSLMASFTSTKVPLK